MLYIKLFLLYSILGFTFESLIFKISNINKHSGALTGPYTLVYGIGGTICFFLYYYLNNINNNFLNYLLCFITFTIVCTIIEFFIGHLIKLIYQFDSWDYSYRKYHVGKYISLDFAFVWGFMSLIFTKYLHTFFISVANTLSNKFTIIAIIIIFIDIIFTFIKTKK